MHAHSAESIEQILGTLDDAQRAVATTFGAPLVVRAGAGSGKTSAMSHRIAYGVHTGKYVEQRIMALTFTKKAAQELDARLQRLGVQHPVSRTFHSAALAQLKYFWPQLTERFAPKVLSGKSRMLAEVLENLKIPHFDAVLLRDLAAEIEWRKVNNLTIEHYAANVRDRVEGLSHEQVCEAMQMYENFKDDLFVVDFEDILLTVCGMLEAEPTVVEQVQRQYRSFLVDEYQDVSALQQRLLDLWLGKRNDLVVVGDAAQTIYRFAGARSEYLLRFHERYQGAVELTLDQNYRSTPTILRFANQLLTDEPGVIELKPARKQNETSQDIVYATFRDDEHESGEVVIQIQSLIAQGVLPQDIAVLFRINAQSAPFEQKLSEKNIPYLLQGSKPFFERTEIKEAIMLLRGAAFGAEQQPVEPMLITLLNSSHIGWTETPPAKGSAKFEWWSSLKLLSDLAQEHKDMGAGEFLELLKRMQDTEQSPDNAAVSLLSMHSAKGKEWKHVFLVGLSEGLLPVSMATNEELIREERRLFYVGVTRAMDGLYLSWAKHDRSGSERKRSRFLSTLERLPVR